MPQEEFDDFDALPRPFGPFTLIRNIAQGGMGQVFLALRPVDDEPVDEICVVKTVRPDLKGDKEAVGRFLDEAKVVQKLAHPTICHTLDAGFVDETYFLALEFISGRNLRDVQTRAQKLGKKLPQELIFHAITEVLSALHYAHGLVDKKTGRALGIVHRDVSPHNVMLGFDGKTKLIDFGLASHGLKLEMTKPGIMVGKLRYNAPEQVRDRALDGRSDLYSVGVMLYEFLSGERYYEGLTEEAVWRVAMEGNHRPPSYDGLPRDVRAVLDMALCNDPLERFRTADDMRRAVVGLASARGIRVGSATAQRFMTEIFAAECAAERAMILEATGLAEARTTMLPPAKRTLSDFQDKSGSVGRTHAMSPREVRSRLNELVSHYDPNAMTAMPNRPSDAELGLRAPARPRATDASDSDDELHRAQSMFDDVSDTEAHAHGLDASAAIDQTIAARPKAKGSSQQRSTQSGAAPVPAAVVKRREPERSREHQRPARHVRTVEAKPAQRSLLPLLVGVVVVLTLLVAGLALAIVRSMPERTPATSQPQSEPARVAAQPDPVATAKLQAQQPAPSVADIVAAVDAGVVDAPAANVGAADGAAVDAVAVDEAVVDEAATIPRIELADGRTVATKRKRKPPPPGDLKTLKDQVLYLERHCVIRVACARGVIDRAKRIAVLSPSDTKSLIEDTPRCVAKCAQ